MEDYNPINNRFISSYFGMCLIIGERKCGKTNFIHNLIDTIDPYNKNICFYLSKEELYKFKHQNKSIIYLDSLCLETFLKIDKFQIDNEFKHSILIIDGYEKIDKFLYRYIFYLKGKNMSILITQENPNIIDYEYIQMIDYVFCFKQLYLCNIQYLYQNFVNKYDNKIFEDVVRNLKQYSLLILSNKEDIDDSIFIIYQSYLYKKCQQQREKKIKDNIDRISYNIPTGISKYIRFLQQYIFFTGIGSLTHKHKLKNATVCVDNIQE